MLSKAAYEAYTFGDQTVLDFAGIVHSPEWGSTVYQLSGRKALANSEGRRTLPRIEGTRRIEPPDGFTGKPGTPPVTVREPNSRHDIMRVSSRSRGEEENTMIEPWVDVDADLAAINAGQGLYDNGTSRVWVNGRLYGFYPHSGTAWPIEGEGLIPTTQIQHFALRTLVRYNGINVRSERELTSNPDLTDTDREHVYRLWRMREEGKKT